MPRKQTQILKIHDFRSLILATTMSQLGDRLTHMLLIALIALSKPGSLLAYSEGALTFALPTLILSPIAGVLVDRWDKRQVLAVTHFIQSALLLVTPVFIMLFHSFTPFWISLFLFFGLDIFNNTAAPALLPTLVGQKRILLANSVSLTFARVATVLGMLIGGFLIQWVGPNLGLAIDSTTHLAAGLLALTIVTRTRPAPPQTRLAGTVTNALVRFLRELRDVFLLVGRNRLVGFVMGSIVISTFVSAIAYTSLLFMVQQALGLGTAGVGIFAGILAVGMIGGAASMSFVHQDINRPLVIIGAIMLYGIFFLIGTWFISIPFIIVLALAGGVSFSWVGIVQNTILQEEVAPEIRGRIFSTREFITNATFIITALLVGLLGDLTSYRIVFPVVGILLLLSAVTGLFFIKSGFSRASAK